MTNFLKLSVVFLILPLVACSGGKTNANATIQEDNKPIVKIATVSSRAVDQIGEYSGTIEAKIKNNIAPQAPIRIANIFVVIGDRVMKGQRVVQMDASNLTQLELQLNNRKIEFGRIDELYKVGGISKSEWDAAKTALDISASTYKNMLENTYLLSPISGVISARNYDRGDLYNGSVPVLTVEQINPAKLFVNLSESHFAQVNLNDTLQVRLDVYPDQLFNGKVSLIYPTIDPTTRTFTVEVEIPNPKLRVRPGMFARAILNYGSQLRVVVPDQAIVKQVGAGDRYVYVYKDGRVSYNKVELGQRMGCEYELLAGIESNDQVVIAGQSKLQDGVEVQVIQ